MLSTVISVLIVLVVLLLFTAALLIFRATMYGRVPEVVEPVEPVGVEGPVVAEHLGLALRLQTVSMEDREAVDFNTFAAFHRLLERLYPRLHATLLRETVNEYSLLYTWPGRAAELPPVVLLGHQDVVPADPDTLAQWVYPPFDGTVANGCVWGRGALDDKGTVIAIMEAVEGLIRAGYQPERTIYLAFGHDEELGGLNGARCIVEELERRGVHLAAAIDEGGAIMQGLLPGLNVPAALVGVAEKGHMVVELCVEGQPGHSAMPPQHTVIGVLARAITRLEQSPMPERNTLTGPMFKSLGAFLPFMQRLALANLWLFGGLVRKQLAASPTTNAMIRTTQAVTMMQGGVKDNVLPAQARALVNCRILPGDTREMVVEHIRKAVNDEAIQISVAEDTAWEPSPVSSTDSLIYQNLVRTIREVYPDAVVAPYLVMMATDSRHYVKICPNVYRFSPYTVNQELLNSIHGINERIAVDDLVRMVQFYSQIIRSWTTVVGTAG